MAKLTTEAWERAIADAAAALNEQALTEGVDGADDLAPVVDAITFHAGEPSISEAIRKLSYLLVRANRSMPAIWTPLQASAANGWSTGLDGRPAASWRRLLDGRIQLRGRLSGSALGVICGQLPVGARPPESKLWTVGASGGSLTARVNVSSTGFVILEAWGTGASGWLELEAVTFETL